MTRREFLINTAALATAAGAHAKPAARPVVSVVRIKNGKVAFAVEKAIDLLGGMKRVTKGSTPSC
jgi:hypothetical protein